MVKVEIFKQHITIYSQLSVFDTLNKNKAKSLFLYRFKHKFIHIYVYFIHLQIYRVVLFNFIFVLKILNRNMRKRNEDFNLLPIAEDYFQNIFGEISGMKGLILDKETSGIISIVYTQSKLYKNDIYLIQKIEDSSQKLPHLKAIYFVRPTAQNIDLIIKQLKDPRFHQYHLFFTNQIHSKMIDQLAANDPNDRIKNIQEVYLDYYALGRNIFSLNIPSSIGLTRKQNFWDEKDKAVLNRITEGLISTIMSLRLMPEIRYLNGSAACSSIANKITQKMQNQLRQKQSDYLLDQRAILIITQRKEDIVTPLLTPWTYLSMLHQFIGVYNNKVDIVNKQKAFLHNGQSKGKNLTIKQKQQKEFVLSEITDEFYKKNIYMGFGQLANNIKSFISEVSQKRNKTIKLDSLEDMHSALDKVPQLNALSATLQKHVTLSCQISQQIEKGVLFEVSKVEQDLICQDSRTNNIEGIWKILKNEKIQYYLKFKLVLLYSIKYPNDKQIQSFQTYLSQINSDKSLLGLIGLLGQYQTGHKSDLFHLNNIKKKAKSYFDRMLKDVPNVYTQHRPYLFEQILPDLINEKLKETDYPVIFNRRTNVGNRRPVVIVFFVGGVTYTQAKQADEYDPAKVIVGGSFIHNSKTFIGEIIQLQSMQ